MASPVENRESVLCAVRDCLVSLSGQGLAQVPWRELKEVYREQLGRELLPQALGFPTVLELLHEAAGRGFCRLERAGGTTMVSAPSISPLPLEEPWDWKQVDAGQHQVLQVQA